MAFNVLFLFHQSHRLQSNLNHSQFSGIFSRSVYSGPRINETRLFCALFG